MQAKILQNLSANPNLTPQPLAFVLARGARFARATRTERGLHAGRALAKVNYDTCAMLFYLRQGKRDQRLAAFTPGKDIVDDLVPVNADRRRVGACDLSEDQRKMLHAVERRGVGDSLGRADLGVDLELLDALDQPLAGAAISNQIGDEKGDSCSVAKGC